MIFADNFDQFSPSTTAFCQVTSKRALRTQSVLLYSVAFLFYHSKKNEYMHLLVNCGSPKLSTCDEGRN